MAHGQVGPQMETHVRRARAQDAMIRMQMTAGQTPATKAYFVDDAGLVFAKFGDAPWHGPDVILAERRSRTVTVSTGEKGQWQASWSDVTVVASYDENDDLLDVEVIGVPKRRPAAKPD